MYLTATLTNQTGYWELFVPQVVRGLGLICCYLPANMIALGTLPQDNMRNAAGLYNLTRPPSRSSRPATSSCIAGSATTATAEMSPARYLQLRPIRTRRGAGICEQGFRADAMPASGDQDSL
jgi:hypothetical protein